MLNICISFDHELFFGENFFSEEEILFKPTYRLMDVLVKNKIGATFFTDVCSVFKYQSLGMNEYPEQMATQLKKLITNKQDVQLHIHSHWYKSEYINSRWQFDKNSYRIHSFGFDNNADGTLTASKIIKEGKQYLETLLQTVNKEYKCIAYRAGGFCLQPEHDLLKALKENGIVIDSSIPKGAHSDADVLYYSYLHLPMSINWWINPILGISKEAKGNAIDNIFEVPIGSIHKFGFNLKIRKYQKPFQTTIAKGTYIPLIQPKVSKMKQLFLRINSILTSPIILSLDSYRDDVLFEILKEYLIDYNCNENDYYISAICHPKLMDEGRIQNMETFIGKVKQNLPLVEFVTMHDIYTKISNKKEA